MARVPGGRTLECVAGGNEARLVEMTATNWNAIGPPFAANPPGSVMVGLPVISNGQVKRSSPPISEASSPSDAILASVGAA